jgi:hypothetical protein
MISGIVLDQSSVPSAVVPAKNRVEKGTLTIFTLLVAVAPVSTVLECGVG